MPEMLACKENQGRTKTPGGGVSGEDGAAVSCRCNEPPGPWMLLLGVCSVFWCGVFLLAAYFLDWPQPLPEWFVPTAGVGLGAGILAALSAMARLAQWAERP